MKVLISPAGIYAVHQLLSDYIAAFTGMPLNENELIAIRQAFKYKKCRRYQYFFQEGDICKYMAFLISGSMRMFAVSEKGMEHTMDLALEQTWVCDYESYNMLTPTRYYLQAVEDTELLMISNEHLQYLIQEIPAVAAMVRKIELNNMINRQNRIYAIISLSADARYHNLLNANPVFARRFSLAMIASYLGVSPETLSRVRKAALTR
jgi:CRP-like cAMP-binding protein